MTTVTVKTKTGKGLHLRREAIKSKTICGRPILKGWDDVEEDIGPRTCGQCLDIWERANDHDHSRDDDAFSYMYDAEV